MPSAKKHKSDAPPPAKFRSLSATAGGYALCFLSIPKICAARRVATWLRPYCDAAMDFDHKVLARRARLDPTVEKCLVVCQRVTSVERAVSVIESKIAAAKELVGIDPKMERHTPYFLLSEFFTYLSMLRPGAKCIGGLSLSRPGRFTRLKSLNVEWSPNTAVELDAEQLPHLETLCVCPQANRIGTWINLEEFLLGCPRTLRHLDLSDVQVHVRNNEGVLHDKPDDIVRLKSFKLRDACDELPSEQIEEILKVLPRSIEALALLFPEIPPNVPDEYAFSDAIVDLLATHFDDLSDLELPRKVNARFYANLLNRCPRLKTASIAHPDVVTHLTAHGYPSVKIMSWHLGTSEQQRSVESHTRKFPNIQTLEISPHMPVCFGLLDSTVDALANLRRLTLCNMLYIAGAFSVFQRLKSLEHLSFELGGIETGENQCENQAGEDLGKCPNLRSLCFVAWNVDAVGKILTNVMHAVLKNDRRTQMWVSYKYEPPQSSPGARSEVSLRKAMNLINCMRVFRKAFRRQGKTLSYRIGFHDSLYAINDETFSKNVQGSEPF